MLKKRGAGVLLHISSMPSEYGVGVFDENVIHFIDKIADMGFTYWQVLPFNPLDGANSPYCSPSAFAGNYLFINPKGLFDMNLVSEEDYKSNIYTGTPYTADYEFAAEKRLELLKKAFLNIDDDIAKEIKEFEINNSWLTDYSVFMAVKEQENMKPWWEWSDKHAHYFECIKDIYSYEESAAFWKFVQYIFYRQWNEIKSYANKKGIAVIGDMPIYVAMDSVDVWSNLPMFLIDEKTLKVEKVAGVPPDYFSKTGQRWGNPIYNWKKIEEDNFLWWRKRMEHSAKLYDVIRIDHFIGMVKYYSIPAKDEDARNGKWQKGPGMKLIKAINESIGDKKIVAEDLGVKMPEVAEVLENSGYPGMKVLEFAFDGDRKNGHLPYNWDKNIVAYGGTHDNDTLVGYFTGLEWWELGYIREYMECRNGTIEDLVDKIFMTAYASVANVVIFQMQDVLKVGNIGRMNLPSSMGTNWRWRMLPGEFSAEKIERLRYLCDIYGR